ENAAALNLSVSSTSMLINSPNVDNPDSEFSNSPKSFHHISQLVDDSLKDCNSDSLNFDFNNTYNCNLLSNNSNFCPPLRQFNSTSSNEIQFNSASARTSNNEIQFNSILARISSNEDKNIPLKKRKVDYHPTLDYTPPLGYTPTLLMGIAEVLEHKADLANNLSQNSSINYDFTTINGVVIAREAGKENLLTLDPDKQHINKDFQNNENYSIRNCKPCKMT
ncbi:hypothetical protein ILUMI_03582, partial [Ignelater luminosus]